MSSPQTLVSSRENLRRLAPEGIPAWVVPAALLSAGLIVRLVNAFCRFLNPDEVLHYLLSVAPSFAAAERASLTTSHPPLLIVFLHYWGMIGHSEWFLRLPSVLAGIAFCWVMYRWTQRFLGEDTALIALILWLFSPTLIQMTVEVRQYAFLMLFSALSLYFLDDAIERDSAASVGFSCLALYLALLVHYAALIVALTLGIYAIVRWAAARTRVQTTLTWIAGQAGALGIVAFLFVHHFSKLRARGQPHEVAETYVHRSIFWPGQERALSFIGRNTVRLFHYFFSQGAVGVLALLLFICGLVLLARKRSSVRRRAPNPAQLAFLFSFPVFVTCVTALLQLYPYGGTRHDCYLAIFIMPAIGVTVAHWLPARRWWKLAMLGAVLAVCNLFPAPLAEYIHFRDQRRQLMTDAISSIRSLPRNSTIFTDDQGGMMLSYYLCNTRVVQIEQLPPEPFFKQRCGSNWIISLDPRLWMFRAETFPDTMRRMQETYQLNPSTPVWLFQSGWYIDYEFAFREELKQHGCTQPLDFGRNMFLCRITPHSQ